MALRIAWRLAWVLMLAVAAGSATGWRYQHGRADTLAALETASARAACIVRVETGGTYDPNVVGAQGEQGAAQLHPRGLLPTFYRLGWTDPYDPYQAVAFVDWALDAGLAHHWAAVTVAGC